MTEWVVTNEWAKNNPIRKRVHEKQRLVSDEWFIVGSGICVCLSLFGELNN